jgi:hypothetical protein
MAYLGPLSIAKILTAVLDTLEKLQHHLLVEVLGAFDISAEGHSVIDFDCGPSTDILTKQSVLVS